MTEVYPLQQSNVIMLIHTYVKVILKKKCEKYYTRRKKKEHDDLWCTDTSGNRYVQCPTRIGHSKILKNRRVMCPCRVVSVSPYQCQCILAPNLFMNDAIGNKNRSIKHWELSSIHACNSPTSFFNYLHDQEIDIMQRKKITERSLWKNRSNIKLCRKNKIKIEIFRSESR